VHLSAVKRVGDSCSVEGHTTCTVCRFLLVDSRCWRAEMVLTAVSEIISFKELSSLHHAAGNVARRSCEEICRHNFVIGITSCRHAEITSVFRHALSVMMMSHSLLSTYCTATW
jgi:hypothetical protein